MPKNAKKNNIYLLLVIARIININKKKRQRAYQNKFEFLGHHLYICRDSNSCRSFTLLALEKSNGHNYCYCNSWKSDNFRESNQEKKQISDTINEAKKIKSDKFTRSNREKSNIAIEYWKNE